MAVLAASGRGPAEVCKVLEIGRSTFYKHAQVQAMMSTIKSSHVPFTEEDGEVRELTGADMRNFKPAHEVFPLTLQKLLT